MVSLTKLDGNMIIINPHQIEYIEKHPDTTLTMLSGKHLIVKETSDELVRLIIEYRRKTAVFTERE